MTIADWLHRFRWWPWIFSIPLLALHLWPASWWLTMHIVRIDDARLGQPVYMLVDRTVARSFRAEWTASIRQWDGVAWTTWCNSSSVGNYAPDIRLRSPLTLEWWTDKRCHPLPLGKFRVDTTFTILPDGLLPDKLVSISSNIFEVTP